MTRDDRNLVITSRKTIDVIRAIRELEDAGVTEIANALGMNKSTVHNHLRTLETEELVIRDGSQYRLGLRFLEFGGYVRNRTRLYRFAEPEIRRLAEQTGELANLMTEQYGNGVHLDCSKGNRAVDLSIYAGLHSPLHATALGKSILAHLPESRVEELIERRGLSAETPSTIVERSELLDELDEIRERGFALDDEEFLPGLRCVGVPIRAGDGAVLGSLSVSAPRNRMRNERFTDELPDLAKSAANVVELNLNYS
jgi:DNA-binding IclR family transcriptional regulator